MTLALTGCPPPPVDPVFPEDYRSSYELVRDCRLSIEHDLVRIQVWANDIARDAYVNRDAELPDGSILVKEEFDGDDVGCADPMIGWTVMRREAGFSPSIGDWHWQTLNEEQVVIEDGRISECYMCHDMCDDDEDDEGFDWTCAVP
jgi:hypothetical protein